MRVEYEGLMVEDEGSKVEGASMPAGDSKNCQLSNFNCAEVVPVMVK